MTSTEARISTYICAYCGGYHNYSGAMCKDLHNSHKCAEIAALKEQVREWKEAAVYEAEGMEMWKEESQRLRKALKEILVMADTGTANSTLSAVYLVASEALEDEK